jgi:hypothetical protein
MNALIGSAFVPICAELLFCVRAPGTTVALVVLVGGRV